MNFRNRALARVGAGAVGLIAAGAFAAPALADTGEADVGIKAAGGTITADSSGKFSTISLVNNSKNDAAGILVTLDLSELDQDKVRFTDEACSREGDMVYCGIVGDVLKAGSDVDWLFPLQAVEGATGDAGKITVSIEHDGVDPNPDNNKATLKVQIAEANGPDLLIVAGDVSEKVKVDSDGRLEFVGDLHAGETAALLYFVANFGDRAADGMKITVKLPEGATFTEEEPDCVYSDDNRTAVCEYRNLPIVPADQDESEKDDIYSVYSFYNLITVAEDVAAPATLAGGTVSVEPLVKEQTEMSISSLPAAPELPKNVEGVQSLDVDPTDNVDEFNVIVAGTGGEGGGGGSLPVTGAQAGLIGGIGAVVVALGAVLFFVARRRKVVLVTPQDEKSAE